MTKEKIRVTVSFPLDIHKKLMEIANQQHRSVSSQVVQFCSEKIDEYDENTRTSS